MSAVVTLTGFQDGDSFMAEYRITKWASNEELQMLRFRLRYITASSSRRLRFRRLRLHLCAPRWRGEKSRLSNGLALTALGFTRFVRQCSLVIFSLTSRQENTFLSLLTSSPLAVFLRITCGLLPRRY